MPCIYLHEGVGFRLGLWKITESVDFFSEFISYRSSASNIGVQLQQMASRMLLNELIPGFSFDDIVINESGKPEFPQQHIHFSISHTKGYAAAIISKNSPVGIDIELISDRVLNVERKFLGEVELRLLPPVDDHQRVTYATLCWSIKEAVYKCWGKGGVDFIEHINIIDLPVTDSGKATVRFQKKESLDCKVSCTLFEDLWLTYMMGPL